MIITLNKLTIQKRLSQETLCFSADIYIDNVKIGEVTNHGHGGPNSYHFTNQEKGKELMNYAKETITEYNFEQLDIMIDRIISNMEIWGRML